MPFLICAVPVCSMRAEASHRSEQVSQLLFGETCELLDTDKEFVLIRALHDNYKGWCQQTQLQECEQEETKLKNIKIAAEWVNKIFLNDKPMFIPFGSSLPAGSCIGKNKVDYNGVLINAGENKISEDLMISYTSIFLNTSYLWGGRSVFGVDCSGFTQLIYKCFNISILRDASQQATQGDVVAFLAEVKCGDLAFFDNESGKITHVGILLSPATVIHASGKVRTDTIDDVGIVNSDTGKRTHTLRVIKRMVR